MAWIESHQDLRHHPKLLKLCELTGWSRVEAIGHLHCLWWWVLEYRWKDGDLSDVRPQVVADAMESCGITPEQLMHALTESGLVDNLGKVHDWLDFAGRIVKDRLRKQKERRQLRQRDNHKETAQKRPRTVLGQSTVHPPKTCATEPNRTLRNTKDLGVYPLITCTIGEANMAQF